MFNYFPLNDQTEADMLQRIWSLINTVFDHSCIDCRSGEKSSNASADSRNINRTIASIDEIARKTSGRKVDMLFKANSMEFGCTECGRFGVYKNTKELTEGTFKMPKVMKDMFVHLSNSSPSLVSDLAVAGFLLMGIALLCSGKVIKE